MENHNLSAVRAVEKTQNRGIILFFAAIMQFTVGISYVWSVFQPFVMKEYNWNAATTSMTYTIMVLAFVLGGTIGGKVQDRLNPKTIIILGGILMSVGSFLAIFTPASNPFVLYATFGILSGFGMGCIYNTAVMLSQKWFYDKRGFAGGVVVSALGFSGLMFAPLLNYVISTFGLKTTFLMLTVFFILVCIISSLFIKNPPQGYGASTGTQTFSSKQYTPKEMIKTPNFYILVLSLMCGTTAYLLISPLIMTIGPERGISISMLLVAVMVANLINAVGRIAAASLSDIIGRKKTLIGLFSLSLLSCLGLTFVHGNFLIVLYAVLCLSYGGFFATFPSVTSDSFGIKNSGANYGLVMLGLGLASLLAMLLSFVIQSMGLGITGRFAFSVFIAVIGIVLVCFIKRPKQD